MNKLDLIGFSDFLMIAPFYDLRAFFQPEMINFKGGVEAVMNAGLLRADEDENKIYEIIGNVGIIKIEGPLRPGEDWNGATGYGDIQAAIVDLIDNKSVTTVIQKVDSPGGTVKQAFETHEMFIELAKEKNLISLVTGSATSAAALMTFPAKKRYIASKTAQTGSIGVVSQHVDNRAWYKEFWGEVRTSVAKGDLKDAGTDVRGYDKKAQEVFEPAVNKLYGIFADEAAKWLNKTREQIDAQRSQVYIGDEGITEGLVDGFATLDELIEMANSSSSVFPPSARPTIKTHSGDNRMDQNQFKTEYPDVHQETINAGKESGKETYIDQGKALGVIEERNRMTSIDALALPGQEKLAVELKESGANAEEAAVKFLSAQRETLSSAKSGMEGEINEPLASDVPKPAESPEETVSDPVKEFNAAVAEKESGGKMSKGAAVQEVAKENPELHQSYVNALKGGK